MRKTYSCGRARSLTATFISWHRCRPQSCAKECCSMTQDQRRIIRTQEWLNKAQRDLTAAEQLLAYDDPLLDMVAYHCQQAGEKALKGFLFWHDIPFNRTHSLDELLVQCASLDTTLLA